MKRKLADIERFLHHKWVAFQGMDFIPTDPVSVPHAFSKPQDIEIAGFFAALFAWGNRTTIINKSNELMGWMDKQPHDFCLHASAAELKKIAQFRHRTFTGDDILYFIEFFHHHYTQQPSLESAFTAGMQPGDATVENGLVHFSRYFFSLEHLKRTEKHISSPARHSACKRLNMYLRWMVRNDRIDFGLWKNIRPAQLVCPLDLHVHRVARKLGLLHRPVADWKAALELTEFLARLDPQDPVKFDLVLFTLGAEERY